MTLQDMITMHDFKQTPMGGGCLALTAEINGRDIWLTDAEGCDVPSDDDPILVGAYAAGTADAIDGCTLVEDGTDCGGKTLEEVIATIGN